MEKMRKILVIGAVVLVALLAGVVSAVDATEIPAEISDAYPQKDIGVGGMEISKQIPGTSKIQVTWTASTDIWRQFLGAVKSKHSSTSRTDTGSPYDIDTIGVRGRVWQNDNQKLDQTVTNYNSADAVINWQSNQAYVGGHWLARSNHVFEEGSYSWYPVTEDTLDV